jgi:hypothetical protein
MTDQSNNDLEHPDEIRTPDGQRRDGRPSDGTLDQPKPSDQGGGPPTVAPEERGGSPSTEHAPGGDL